MNTRNLGLILSLIVLLSVAAAVFVWRSTAKKAEDVHMHAAFVLVENGQAVDFSAAQYMHIKPCGDSESQGKKLSPEAEQLEKAHLHDGAGDIVHVHRAGATWRDLFMNLSVTLSSEITGSVDGVAVEGILDRTITPYSRVLIVQGISTDTERFLSAVPTIERMKEVEQQSEGCGV